MRDNKLFKRMKRKLFNKWPLLEEPDFIFICFTVFVMIAALIIDWMI